MALRRSGAGRADDGRTDASHVHRGYARLPAPGRPDEGQPGPRWNLLGIKPVLWLNEGRIELWSRTRGKKKALRRCSTRRYGHAGGEPVRAFIFTRPPSAEAAALGVALRGRLMGRTPRSRPDRARGSRPRGTGLRRVGGVPCERHVLMPAEPAPDESSRWEPPYLALHRSGELRRRAREAMASLAACELCPHACKANRLEGKHGVCRMDGEPSSRRGTSTRGKSRRSPARAVRARSSSPAARAAAASARTTRSARWVTATGSASSALPA